MVDYTYEPYGYTTADAAIYNPFQYTGRENDGNGLYYYRARYYSPAMQRFISEDPIGLAGGINVYSYVNENPISFTDPLGLYSFGEFFSDAGSFFGGMGSYPRGVFRTFYYDARRYGLLGDCEKQDAELEGLIAAEAVNQLITNSDFRKEARKAAKDYASNNAYIAGRLGTGAAVSYGLSRAGPLGTVLAVSLNASAINGDIRSAVQSGASSAQTIGPAILGGATVNKGNP